MKRKWIVFCLMAALVLSVTGMQNIAFATESHTHVAADAYSWNGIEHWHACECGEKLDLAAHKLGEDLVCTDCGLEVLAQDDGYVDVTMYDEYGNLVSLFSYDPDGNILWSEECVNDYDELGNIVYSEYFVDGVLVSCDEYKLDEDGMPVHFSTSYYYEGELNYMEYDANGELVYYAHHDLDGKITSESWYEYAENDEGDSYACQMISVEETGEKIEAGYTQYEDVTFRRIYDADGNLISDETWEYEYDEEGKREWVKKYDNGVLTWEVTNYAEHTDEWGTRTRYAETYIEYYEDGSKLVIFNGTNGEPETETLYNADGSVASVRSYLYEYFEDGNWKRIQVYQDDKLISDTEYVMDAENIFSLMATKTEYHEDGTKTVYQYDEYEDVASEKNYDVDGNEI